MLRYALGGIVLSVSTHSAALSLGGHSGQAVIGRALDMQVRTTASLAELESSACLEAQVSYGDTRLAAGAVSIQLQSGADGNGSVIRVRTNLPVNEPLVTVLLRAGCSGETFSRRYVLLSDVDLPAPAASGVTAVAPSSTPTATSAPQALPVPAPAPAPAVPLPSAARSAATPAPAPRPAVASPAPAPAPRAKAPAPAPAPRAKAPAPAPAPAPRAKAAAPAPTPAKAAPAPSPAPAPSAAPAPAPAAEPAPGGSRLKLDPVDLAPQGAPTLRSTFELQSTPTDSDERRQAAQALWNALNAPPEQQIQDARKLATLEQEVQGLRAEEAKLKGSIESLQRELQAARDDSTPGWLLALLGGALAAALAALAWLLRERRRAVAQQPASSQPWWQSSQQVDADGPGQALSDMAQAEAGWSPPVTTAALDDDADSGVEVSEATESSFAMLHEEVPAEVEMLVDLNQHCEFFESLGQRSDAMSVLEDFVGRHPSASEMPYLWLLRLADEQGRSDEKQRWSRRYEQAFGRQAPLPDTYDRAAQGLLGQERWMAALERVWPGAAAEELLCQAALARPGMSPLLRPTLADYQDLLLLHTLVQSMPPESAAAHPAPAAGEPPRAAEAPEAWPSVATAPMPFEPEVPELPETPDELAPTQPAALDLDLDLTLPDAAPPPPVAENAAPPDAEDAGRELPMLDFDLFELEPRPSAIKKTGEADDADKKG